MNFQKGEEVLIENGRKDFLRARIISYNDFSETYDVQVDNWKKPLKEVPWDIILPSEDTLLARDIFETVGITF